MPPRKHIRSSRTAADRNHQENHVRDGGLIFGDTYHGASSGIRGPNDEKYESRQWTSESYIYYAILCFVWLVMLLVGYKLKIKLQHIFRRAFACVY